VGVVIGILIAASIGLNVSGILSYWDPTMPWPMFNGSDSFAHAHRVRSMIENSMAPSFKDPMFNYPYGAALEWPMGFSFLVALVLYLPAQIAGGLAPIAATLLFAQVVIGAVTCVVLFLVARRSMGPWLAFGCAACFALNGAFRMVTSVGGLDHHCVEVLCVVLLMGMPRLLEQRQALRLATGWGVALALCAWCSTVSAYLIAGYFFLMCLTAQTTSHLKPLRALSAGLLLPLFGLAAWESIFRGRFFDIRTLSLVQPILLAVGIVFVTLRFKGRTRWMIGLAMAFGALGLVLAWHSVLWTVEFLLSKSGVWSYLGEMRPLVLSDSGLTFSLVHAEFGVLYLVSPFVFLWPLRLGRKALFDYGSFFFLMLFLLSFAQQRFTHLFAPCFVWLLFEMTNALWNSSRRSKILAFSILIALLIEPAIAFIRPIQANAPSVASEQARELARILEHEDPAGREPVFAPPNFGNALVWLTRRPVVSNTFFYPARFVFDLRVRQARTTAELVTLLRSRGIKYFVAADDARFRVMLHELMNQQGEAQIWRSVQYSPCHSVLLQFAYDRLACDRDKNNELALIAKLTFPGSSLNLLRRLRVFELVGSP
jgi:hypothetical protein